MGNRLREAASLVETLTKRPKEFPSALLVLFKHFARNIWDLRGGGLYACGFIVALVWLELKMLIQDVMGFSGFGDFSAGHILQIIFRFALESIMNTVQALLWPVTIIEIYPPWGLVALAAMYIVFPRLIKLPLEDWLFDGERSPTKTD